MLVVDERVVDDAGVVALAVVTVVVVVCSDSSSAPKMAPQPPHKQSAATITPTTMRMLRLVRLRCARFAACRSWYAICAVLSVGGKLRPAAPRNNRRRYKICFTQRFTLMLHG
ncbi:hypothetical protein [Nocardia testacea]|uniref:hypothetical protein n=1 Tax=Nocardia testacea TaxID=248551 RepID=UPI0033CC4E85